MIIIFDRAKRGWDAAEAYYRLSEWISGIIQTDEVSRSNIYII